MITSYATFLNLPDFGTYSSCINTDCPALHRRVRGRSSTLSIASTRRCGGLSRLFGVGTACVLCMPPVLHTSSHTSRASYRAELVCGTGIGAHSTSELRVAAGDLHDGRERHVVYCYTRCRERAACPLLRIRSSSTDRLVAAVPFIALCRANPSHQMQNVYDRQHFERHQKQAPP